MKLWLGDEKNVQEIKNKLIETYNLDDLNPLFIYKFLDNCRKAIANYIRSIYVLDPLSSTNSFNHIAVDESLFSHNLGRQLWVVGLINCETNEIRLELTEQRNEKLLKTIILKHVQKGNIVNTDGWSGYLFLNNPANGYIHHTYNHARGNFGTGLDSTSRIESVWSELKSKITKIYNSIQSTNFIYFLRELEFRRIIKSWIINQNIEQFGIALSCVGNGINSTYLTKDELISLSYDIYYED